MYGPGLESKTRPGTMRNTESMHCMYLTLEPTAIVYGVLGMYLILRRETDFLMKCVLSPRVRAHIVFRTVEQVEMRHAAHIPCSLSSSSKKKRKKEKKRRKERERGRETQGLTACWIAGLWSV
ncbi:uncharacterized protein CIMG_02616 [Coccidioides immitis RS]|uniref:Uncharacterized protein n=1 Tax=Coccidioides immitis (strain RS) TaxID=246410 RepID=J3KLR0_COCIM|nr:uncharacterized protein CIMG_02616 [Coccidioides immitis RS]EAS37262.3 hypothetical protein CIMG_02616 [Coccidioides immitis RS]